MIIYSLILIFCLIFILGKGKYLDIIYIFFLFALFTYSFYIEVPDSFDLVKHKLRVEIFENLSFGDSLSAFYVYSDQPAITIYYFAISKLGDSRFLSAITTTLIYLFFIISNRIIFRYLNTSKYYEALSFCCFILSFNYVDTLGIRQYLAFSIFFLGLCIDHFKVKNYVIPILLYILSISIHNSIIILIFIRLLMILPKHILLNKLMLILTPFWFLATSQILVYLGRMSGVEFLASINNKLALYVEVGNTMSGVFYVINTILKVALAFTVIFLLLNELNKNQIFERLNVSFLYFVYVMLFSLGAVFVSYSLFNRFSSLYAYILPFIFVSMNLNKVKANNIILKNTILALLLSCLFVANVFYLIIFQYSTLDVDFSSLLTAW
ncbi:EpsG family protein [Vibrio breoganii]